MASNSPQKCCIVGVKHEGEAVGEYGKIGDSAAYFSYPEDKSTKNAILIVPDVYGHKAINVQLIADQFAANGFFTVVLDPFDGDDVPAVRPPGFDIMEWVGRHGTDLVDPKVEASIQELRGKYGAQKVGGVGYCFGAKYVVRFLKPGKFDAGYGAHPSFVSEEELKGVEKPYSIAAAETDTVFTDEKRHASEVILKGLGHPWQIFLYSGVQHGFSVRGDLSNPIVKLGKEQAFLQAVNWFDEFVKKP